MPDRPHPTDEERPPRVSRLLRFLVRWGRRLAILMVGLLLVLAGLYVTREHTLHPLLQRAVPGLSTRFTPYEVHVEDIDGDWTRELTLRGVAVTAQDKSVPMRMLAADELRIKGPLVRIVRGAPVGPDTTIRIQRGQVAIDAGLVMATEPTDPNLGPLDAVAGALLDVNDSTVTLTTETDTIRLEALEAHGRSTAAEPLAITARASATEWSAILGLSLVARGDGITAFEGSVPEGRAREIDLSITDLVGEFGVGSTRIESGTLTVGSNRVDASGVEVRTGADSDLTIGGDLGLRFDDLASARGAVGAFTNSQAGLRWGGRAYGSITLTPAPGKIATGRATLTGEGIEVEGLRLGSVQASLVAADDYIEVSRLVADDGDSHIEGSGRYLHASQSFDDFALDLKIEQPDRYAPGLAFLSGVEGDVTLTGPVRAPDGTLRLRASEVRAGAVRLAGVRFEGTMHAGDLDLRSAEALTRYGQLDAKGTIALPIAGRALGIRVREFSIERDGQLLRLQRPVAIEVGGGDVVIDDLQLDGSAGFLALSIDTRDQTGPGVDPSSGSNVVRARAKNLRLTPFVRTMLDEGVDLGRLDGTVDVRATPARADINLTMEGLGIDATDVPVVARLRGTWNEGIATIDEAYASLPDLSVVLRGSAPLALPIGTFANAPLLASGDVTLRGSATLSADAARSDALRILLGTAPPAWATRLDGGLGATIRLSGAWDALVGNVALNLDHIALPRQDGATLLEGTNGRGPWLPAPLVGKVTFELTDAVRIVPSSVALGDAATIQLGGSLDHALDLRAWTENPARARKSWMSAALDASADVVCEDLGWVASFAPELRETSGRVTLLGRATGTLDQLAPSGRLTVEDGSTRYRGAPPIENAQLDIELEPDQVHITNATLELGAAPVVVTGNMLLGQGQPRFDVAIQGTEVLLTRTRNARLRANVDLKLQGRTNAPQVLGEVALVGGRVKSPVEFQRLLSGGSTGPAAVQRGYRLPSLGPKNVALDLHVTTADPIRLEGRITRGSIRADLQIRGNAERPTPDGRIFFDPLEVAVPAGTILFPTGLVRFDPDAPTIPRIDLVGNTRLAGYDVTVNIDGDYDKPNIDLSSSPPLAPEDLLLLVLSGQPPSAGGGIEAAGQSVALYVAKDLVRGWFSSGGFDDGDRESFLDRLEVVTGRDVSRSGVLTVEATYKLREGFARTKDALYVVLERDAFEDYGMGLRLVLRLR